MSDQVHVQTLAAGFEPVVDAVATFALADPAWTAQLVVVAGDDTAVDLHVGEGYGDAVHLQASATKGIAGITVAAVLAEHGVEPSTPVAQVWPEFGVAGKAWVSIAQLLSHQVGLLATTGAFTIAQWGQGRAVTADLAAQYPVWAPGSAFGYHALTIGPLADEIVYRLTGKQLWQVWDEKIRTPHDLDFWVRLPAEQEGRIWEVRFPPPVPPPPRTGSLSELAGVQLNAMGADGRWIVSREVIAAGVPSISGTGSARGLAGAYAAAIGLGGHAPVLDAATLAAVTQVQVAGQDLVLGDHRRFAVLFAKPDPGHDFGTAAAFGHDGAGGAVAFADPGTHVAFGYTTGTMPSPGGADPRAMALAQVVRAIRLS